MNITVTNAISHFLERALRPVTVADVCRRYGTGWHTKVVLETVYGIPPETEIHRALARLDVLADRRRSQRDSKSAFFDPNALIGLVMHRNQLSKALELKGE